MNYEKLIKHHAFELSAYDRPKDNQSCFDALGYGYQLNLMDAYVDSLDESGKFELDANIQAALDINPCLVIARYKLTVNLMNKIGEEYRKQVSEIINKDLTEAYELKLEPEDLGARLREEAADRIANI